MAIESFVVPDGFGYLHPFEYAAIRPESGSIIISIPRIAWVLDTMGSEVEIEYVL